MSKIRVHELAKELNKSSKDVIYALKGHGVDVESHMSTISSENADKIRKFFTQPAAKPAQKQETNRLRIIETQRHAAINACPGQHRQSQQLQLCIKRQAVAAMSPEQRNGGRDGQNRKRRSQWPEQKL